MILTSPIFGTRPPVNASSFRRLLISWQLAPGVIWVPNRSMLLTPELCRAARALLKWKVQHLASAAGLAEATVRRFEASGLVWLTSVEAMVQAFEGAGLELIPAGGKSLEGGPGLRMIPLVEPEVAAAEEAVELNEPALSLEMDGP